jgi:serine/threonine-protein kinase HipA
MPGTRLLVTEREDGPRRHFAVRRFDRIGRERVHHHTLAGLCQAGGGDLDYTTFLRVTRRLTRADPEVQRAFRRAAFNVFASNRDDHGKNHGFLYRNRQWELAPAYDLTFASPEQLPERGMAVAGERRLAGIDQLRRLAAAEDLSLREVDGVIEQVRSSVGRWLEFAAKAGVPDSKAREVDVALRRQLG